jgi:hypothetical protein
MGTASGAGRVHIIFGGPSGSWLTRTARTDSPDTTSGGQFGSALHVCGDTDGDGVADVIVGAWNQSGSAGRAYLFRNAGAATLTLDAPDGANSKFGVSVY